jgi:hypothetical protein
MAIRYRTMGIEEMSRIIGVTCDSQNSPYPYEKIKDVIKSWIQSY